MNESTNSGNKQQPPITMRDGGNESLWQSVKTEARTSTIEDTVYDVLIVGGGITGTTAALLLQKSGKKCLLADAHNIGFGTTGGTSAHINTFADTSYSEAESAFGEQGAKLFAQAINSGFDRIRKNIDEHKIDCDFEPKQGFLYAEDDEQVKELEDVYKGTIKVGVPVNFAKNVPTPVGYKEALVFDNQAQFHPLKYINGLLNAYVSAGGAVAENTCINSVKSEDNIHYAYAGDLTIKAKNIVYATHIPPGLNILNLRCAPYRSYVMAVTLKDGSYPDALVYDMQDPYHYFRTHTVNGQKYLIAGGNDHKTGHEEPDKAFAELEKYLRRYYNIDEVQYKWSSQYYVPVDGLPYIGHMPGAAEGIYCATGYNGNGMMLGSVAAEVLTDIITGRQNDLIQLFAPARIKPVAGFKEFVTENADVAYQFVALRLGTHEMEQLSSLKKDSGQVVEFQGKKIAVYRDSNGEIHAVDPVCTHAKCIVTWNGEEKSWDCPCHGARYSVDGIVLNGPANINLRKVTL